MGAINNFSQIKDKFLYLMFKSETFLTFKLVLSSELKLFCLLMVDLAIQSLLSAILLTTPKLLSWSMFQVKNCCSSLHIRFIFYLIYSLKVKFLGWKSKKHLDISKRIEKKYRNRDTQPGSGQMFN